MSRQAKRKLKERKNMECKNIFENEDETLDNALFINIPVVFIPFDYEPKWGNIEVCLHVSSLKMMDAMNAMDAMNGMIFENKNKAEKIWRQRRKPLVYFVFGFDAHSEEGKQQQ